MFHIQSCTQISGPWLVRLHNHILHSFISSVTMASLLHHDPTRQTQLVRLVSLVTLQPAVLQNSHKTWRDRRSWAAPMVCYNVGVNAQRSGALAVMLLYCSLGKQPLFCHMMYLPPCDLLMLYLRRNAKGVSLQHLINNRIFLFCIEYGQGVNTCFQKQLETLDRSWVFQRNGCTYI